MTANAVMTFVNSPQAYGNLYGVFNTRRYTLVHGFCFKLFLMVGKELIRVVLVYRYGRLYTCTELSPPPFRMTVRCIAHELILRREIVLDDAGIVTNRSFDIHSCMNLL